MKKEKYNILVVDDDSSIRRLLTRIFDDEPFVVQTAVNGYEALEKISSYYFHAVIVDLRMDEMTGEELVNKILEETPQTAVLILTGYGSIDSAVRLMKKGIFDYLEKPVHPEIILERVLRACRYKATERHNLHLNRETEAAVHFDNIIGSSPSMNRIFNMIMKVAPKSNSILIQGESGTGKELVAKAIHNLSNRKKQPFLPIDCGAVNPNLIESELFGHTKGAFTGAVHSTKGLFRSAGDGTVFLDEVDHLPFSAQASLLRVLQEKEVRPVGSVDVFPVKSRLISAAKCDLEEKMKTNEFREDLFYRLNVVQIKLPPLRDRKEDIVPLIDYFLNMFCRQNNVQKKFSDQAFQIFHDYYWPGNVRELENSVESAIVLSSGEIINPEDLPERIRFSQIDPNKQNDGMIMLKEGSIEAYEKRAIIDALKRAQGNRRKAAKILSIGEATLYRKIKRYKLN